MYKMLHNNTLFFFIRDGLPVRFVSKQWRIFEIFEHSCHNRASSQLLFTLKVPLNVIAVLEMLHSVGKLYSRQIYKSKVALNASIIGINL